MRHYVRVRLLPMLRGVYDTQVVWSAHVDHIVARLPSPHL